MGITVLQGGEDVKRATNISRKVNRATLRGRTGLSAVQVKLYN
jgi:hypothetical protein